MGVYFTCVVELDIFFWVERTTPGHNHDELSDFEFIFYTFVLFGREGRRDGGTKGEMRGKIYMVNGCGYGFYGWPELSLD